jgi:hypothetical protein
MLDELVKAAAKAIQKDKLERRLEHGEKPPKLEEGLWATVTLNFQVMQPQVPGRGDEGERQVVKVTALARDFGEQEATVHEVLIDVEALE